MSTSKRISNDTLTALIGSEDDAAWIVSEFEKLEADNAILKAQRDAYAEELGRMRLKMTRREKIFHNPPDPHFDGQRGRMDDEPWFDAKAWHNDRSGSP